MQWTRTGSFGVMERPILTTHAELTLLGTESSHFVRKVRIVLHELWIPFDLEIARDLLAVDSAKYARASYVSLPLIASSPT